MLRKNSNGVVKIKHINEYNVINGKYKTIDIRVNGVDIAKVIKLCFIYKIPFKVGFNDNTLNSNMNYLEATIDTIPGEGDLIRMEETDNFITAIQALKK